MAIDSATKRFSFHWINYPDASVDQQDGLALDWVYATDDTFPIGTANTGVRSGARGRYLRPMARFVSTILIWLMI